MCIDCDMQASLINQNNAMTIAALASAAKDLSLHVNHGSEKQIKEILQTISQLTHKPELVKPAQASDAGASHDNLGRRATDTENTAGQTDAAASLANKPLNGEAEAPRRTESKKLRGLLDLLSFLKELEEKEQSAKPEGAFEFKLVAPEGASKEEILLARDLIAKQHGIDPSAIQIV